MLNKRIIATIIFGIMLASVEVTADNPPPPETLSPSAGTMRPGSTGAGIVTPDDGMDPNALPLSPEPVAPVTPETPATTQPPSTKGSLPPASTVNPKNNPMMEKCKIVDRDGNGLIKGYAADSGPNLEGDANAWIWVPHGQCKKLNQGDYRGVSAEIRNKINPSNIQNAQTLQ